MAVIINTNVDSIKINNILNRATTSMSNAMQRMSSGLQILSAKDDAAGTVISARMEVQLNGNKIAQKNVQNANALLSTAEGNLDVIEDNIQRIRDLTLQAKNGTYSSEEIQAMQDEVEQRIKEINRIDLSAKFSSLKLFGDTTASGLATNGATFQVGPNAGDENTIDASQDLFATVKFSEMTMTQEFNLTTISRLNKNEKGDAAADKPVVFQKMNAAGTGKEDIATTGFDRADYFDKAIEALDNAIDDITHRKSIIGSAGNRMDSALATLSTQHENLASAKSIITDADIAAQASEYTQQSILQQVSTSLLAQANQAPSVALSLV